VGFFEAKKGHEAFYIYDAADSGMNGMQPHEVLHLPREGFTVAQLRYNYKALARQLHPDKRSRDMTLQQATELCQMLTSAYHVLLLEAELRASEGTHDELRRASRAAHARQQGGEGAPANPDHPPVFAGGENNNKFDAKRFNAVFDDNRIGDPVFDGGYGSWSEDALDPMVAAQREAAERKRRRQQQLVHHLDPEPTALTTGVAYSELGAETQLDYSRGGGIATTRAIQYTDYRLAHTTTALADEEELAGARAEFKSIHALQEHRARLTYDISDADAQAEAQRAQELALAEEQRLAAVRRFDRSIESAFERTTRLMLAGRAPPSGSGSGSGIDEVRRLRSG
jgi:curved DNA-binding protein CbpA